MAFDPFDNPDEEKTNPQAQPQEDFFDPFDMPNMPDPAVVGLQKQDTLTPTLDNMNIANRTSGEGTASFGARYGASVVDDPTLKLKIMADDLMPGVEDRYNRIGYVDDKIVYRNPRDNQLYLASSRNLGQKLKDVGATLAGSAPSIVGGMALSPLGPLGTGLGSGAGRFAEKQIAQDVYGQKPNPQQTANEVMLEGMVGTAADAVPLALMKKFGADKAAKIANDVDLKFSVDNGAQWMRQNAKNEYGLDMLPHEATRNPYQKDRFKIAARANPEAGQMADDFLSEVRPQQIDESLDTVSRKMGLRVDNDSNLKGEAFSKAKLAKQKIIDAREKAASKYYKQSFDYSVTDDEFFNIWNTVESQMKNVGDNTMQGEKLKGILKKFFNKDGSPVTSVEGLHNIKVELDTMLDVDLKTSADKILNGKINTIKKELTDTLKESNFLYKKGNEVFRDASKPLDNFNKTLAGKLSRAQNEEDVARIVFGKSDYRNIIKSKQYFDEETWDGIIRAHLIDTFDNVSGLPSSKGFKFRDAVYGNGKKQKSLQAALGEERWHIFDGYMKVLDRMRLSSGGESITAFAKKQQTDMMEEAAQRTVGGKVTNLAEKGADPLAIPKEMVRARKNQKWEEYALEYMNAVLDADPQTAMHNLKRLNYTKPGTEKWLTTLATGLGISSFELSGILQQLPTPEDRLENRGKGQTKSQ